jgi:hypothetical protein
MKCSTAATACALGALVIASAGLAIPRAEAYPPYLQAWQDKYPASTLPARMQATLGSACYVCHEPPNVSVEGTCYRLQLRDILYMSIEIEQALEMLDGVDSDGDGVPNGVEILTPRPEGGVGYHPGLIGELGTSPCGPNPSNPITNSPETPPAACYANCDGSTAEPILNIADFTCFLTKFAAGDPYANCDGSTTAPTLNVADFTCFLTKFAAGCR